MIKRNGKSQIENLIINHKSFKSKGQMKFNWAMLYTVGKIFLRAIRFCFSLKKKKLDLKNI